jgi:hypothetical protein
MGLRKPFTAMLLVVLSSLVLLLFSLVVRVPNSGSRGSQTPDWSSLSQSDLKTLILRLERKGCYGTCPAYTLTIFGDGRVEYTGGKYVKVTGLQKGHIAPSAVKALASEFARAKYLMLPSDEYSQEKCNCRRCTDMPTVISEISLGSLSHHVDHYYGCACASKELFQLETAIDKTANADQWTGDVSKQGPLGTTCFG